MARLYAGTSGWAYPSWKPDFYPAKLAQAKFLQYYATRLNAVEVNFTFRQLLKDTTAQKWIEATPAGFRLSIKAHQVITHIKRLKNTEDFVPRFLGTIEPIARAERLGPLLFQLPPNMKADAKLLGEFLATLPRAVPSAFGTRHGSRTRFSIFSRAATGRFAWQKPKSVSRPTSSPPTSVITVTANPATRLTSGVQWWIAFVSIWRKAGTCSHISSMRKRRRGRFMRLKF
jgi:uncharacterized protein YecE (DUF72 family)